MCHAGPLPAPDRYYALYKPGGKNEFDPVRARSLGVAHAGQEQVAGFLCESMLTGPPGQSGQSVDL
jgi:hypothetical protein